jgi:NAD+ kinase
MATQMDLPNTPPLTDFLPEERKSTKRLIARSADGDTPKKKPVQSKEGEWPLELVLVRHGQSEGNLAQARSKKGDLSSYTPEFKAKHSSAYRLTDQGVMQAKAAGEWIKENIGDSFDRYYTSEYVRAMETAALLDLPQAKWYTEIVLRERDKGHMDNISWTEKNERFGHEMELRKRDSFFWAPPGGESIAQVCIRVDHTFNTLRKECSSKRVIIVCHGEVMWAFRVRLERLSQVSFQKLQASSDKRDQMHNGTILHYTRVHPTTGEIYPYFRFMRSVCPYKPEYSSPGWMEFERPAYSNEELMASVLTVPRLVNNKPGEKHEEKDYSDRAGPKYGAVRAEDTM